jgi:hypothetical protein
MRLGRLACLLVTSALVARASAQTIAPADFLPLGAGAQWLVERTSGSGPTQVRVEVVDVNVESSGTRYLLEVPFEGASTRLRLEFATDGRLLLRALEAQLNEILEDVPFDPKATADVQFSPPALLGEAMLTPGSAVTQTPVDTELDADLDTGVGSVDLDIQVTGTITATWEAAAPIDTPAGRFEDVVRLVIDVQLRFLEDVFDSDVTLTERVDTVLARGVGFAQLSLGDTTYALLRAVIGGVPIGDFPQYEDIVGLSFMVPPLLTLDGRASGEAAAGDFVLHDIRLAHALYGRAFLDAVLDHPTVTGVPIHVEGKAKARKDGGLNVELDGKVVVVDRKVKLKVKQRVDPFSTTLALDLKVGDAKTTIPITIAPVPAATVEVSLDGMVDTSTGGGSERKLSSEGLLRLGDVTYPITCKETLKVKKDGLHKRTYKFRQTGNDKVVIAVEAKSTSAADFTVTSLKPTLFKLEIGKKKVTGLAVEVVGPASPASP